MLEIIYTLFNRFHESEHTWFIGEPPRASLTANSLDRTLIYFCPIFKFITEDLLQWEERGSKVKEHIEKTTFRQDIHYILGSTSPSARIKIWSRLKMTGSRAKKPVFNGDTAWRRINLCCELVWLWGFCYCNMTKPKLMDTIMLAAELTGKINDRELYNGWIRLITLKLPNQS